MDAELLELQRQFESAQQAKSNIRLSERNVVELVGKLQELGFIDFDLLHTASGKEYITPDQLRHEMVAEIEKTGRISLIDLSDIIGVDLYHIEKQAQKIVSDCPGLMLIQGEVISQAYWDLMAEEVNEKLEECSHIVLAEIAAQYHVSSELVLAVIEPRLGTTIKARLEGGQLYTPAYVARVNAMVRGAARGITVPTNLATVWSSLQNLLQDMVGPNGVSVETAFFQSLFNGLVKEEKILGSIRAGIHWTPLVFAHAQKESVESFYSQNSFISYDVLLKLAIPQPRQYLQTRYHSGIQLENVFVHPSLVEMLDAAVMDAIEHGNWIDCLSVLPSSIDSLDASKLLSFCSSVQRALKSELAIILGESNVFSSSYIKDLFKKLEKELEMLACNLTYGQMRESRQSLVLAGSDPDDISSKNTSEKSSKKKKGKPSGSAKATASEDDPSSQENTSKSKKNQRKSKEAAPPSSKMANNKSAVKGEENQNILSEEWVFQMIRRLAPDIEEMGDPDDPQNLAKHFASHLRPSLVISWGKRRNMILMENAETRRRMHDTLQKYLDEAVLDLQLYEKSLEIFEDDPPTSVVLHKHLLRTSACSIVDRILLFLDAENKLTNGVKVEDPQTMETPQMGPADRTALAKNLSGNLSAKAQAAIESLEGKRVDMFLSALGSLAEECGLMVKKLDKKLERTLLHAYRKDLMTHVASETDPVALLPKVLSLLYVQVYNKALQAPGRAVSAALSRLKDKLPDAAYMTVTNYHSATVTLLALISAATGEDDGCSADRILSKRELLESMMPEMKAVALGNLGS
ncbi:E3 UFM1-protein ligase-like protein [Wolffia australiana]